MVHKDYSFNKNFSASVLKLIEVTEAVNLHQSKLGMVPNIYDRVYKFLKPLHETACRKTVIDRFVGSPTLTDLLL